MAAGYTYKPLDPYTGETVTFTGSGCKSGSCTYTWQDDGPDGSGGTNYPLGTGRTLKRTFNGAGVKNVRLTLKDGSRTTSAVKAITVKQGPRPAAGTSPEAPVTEPSPTPTPEPTPEPSPDPQRPVWVGDWETGDRSQWSYTSENSPCSIVIYSNDNKPAGAPDVHQGKYAAQFNGYNNCTGSNTRASAFRAQLFPIGTDWWLGWSTFIPTDWPTRDSTEWFVLQEMGGAPYNGSTYNGIHIETVNGQAVFCRSYRTGHKLWTTPLIKGRWVNFVRHVMFSKDKNQGWEELWLDGQKQTYSCQSGTPSEVRVDPSNPQRLLLPTVLPDQTEAANWSAQCYRRYGSSPSRLTLYHDNARAGHSYADVDPAR